MALPKSLKSLAILVALAGALASSIRLLTTFGFWDDEGYLLISLAHYLKDGNLYTKTFSQYGPFYFYAQGIFFQVVHLPVTHDMGRLVTLFYWLASSALAAAFVYRLSKSTFLASAGGLSIMLAGLVLTNEPGHPQQVLLLLYMTAACFSLPMRNGRLSVQLFLLGCVGAALIFAKVNVGVFYIAGLALALVCLLPSGWTRSLGIAVTAIYAAAVPFLLMHAGFARGFRGYCIVATASAVATLACGALIRPQDSSFWRQALWPAAGLLAGVGLIVIATSLQGISVSSLISGVLLNPLRHPKVFDMPLYISERNSLAMLGLVAGLLALRVFGIRLANARWLNIARCAVGVAAIFLLTLPASAPLVLSPLPTDPLGVLVDSSVHRIHWVAPLLPLVLIPQSHWKTDALALFPRLFITFMAVTQFLEAYPVAGSQMGIAAAPMLLWAFLCLNDGITGLRATSQALPGESLNGLRLDALLGGMILATLAGLTIDLAMHTHISAASTKLKGAGWLHLPPPQRSQYESISTSVAANCSILFSLPGMNSFNLWSGVPTPNGWNLTAWMKEFNIEEQGNILNILQADPRSCAIVNHRVERFWDREEDEASVAALPLVHYITTDMQRVADFGDYEIRANPLRTLPWNKEAQ